MLYLFILTHARARLKFSHRNSRIYTEKYNKITINMRSRNFKNAKIEKCPRF